MTNFGYGAFGSLMVLIIIAVVLIYNLKKEGKL